MSDKILNNINNTLLSARLNKNLTFSDIIKL